MIVGKRAHVDAHASGLATADLAPGESAVYVAVDGRFAGSLILSDRIRDDAAATVAQLDRLGVGHRLMLTGDAEPTARHVAAQAGLAEVAAELLPQDEVRLVAEAGPRPVMMVGNGVNDVPVLAAADVGVAMGARGSTAASESADVVVLADEISRVGVAVAVGRRTLTVAKQSIGAGIALSVVLMLVAATGAIPAILGALSQELVDVVAILNSMRPGRHEATTDLRPASAAARPAVAA